MPGGEIFQESRKHDTTLNSLVRSLLSETVQYETESSSEYVLNEILHRFSFRDSLIAAASLSANCDYLYTEDLQHNQKIGGMTVINPFLD